MLITASPRLRRCVALSAAGLGALVLGACGSDGGSSPSDSDSAAARDAARLKLNECLRRNGVDVQEVPAPGGGGGGAAVRIGGQRDEIEKAMNGPCKKLQQAAFADISPEDRQEFEDAFQKFAQCMREHGVDLPDPTTGGGSGPSNSAVRIDRDDPDFQEAQQACGDKLPEGGFRARAGGGGR